MTEAPCAYLSTGDSIVAAITRNDPNSIDLLDQHFGRGLRFLINRRCSDNDDAYFAEIIEASIKTIRAGDISDDSQIPSLLRKLYDEALTQHPRQLREVEVQFDDAIVAEFARNVTIFAPLQLEALRRFYVEGESALLICENLGLQSDQFDFIRKVALQSANRIRRVRKPARSARNEQETTDVYRA